MLSTQQMLAAVSDGMCDGECILDEKHSSQPFHAGTRNPPLCVPLPGPRKHPLRELASQSSWTVWFALKRSSLFLVAAHQVGFLLLVSWWF